jgi:hypothetical protein
MEGPLYLDTASSTFASDPTLARLFTMVIPIYGAACCIECLLNLFSNPIEYCS